MIVQTFGTGKLGVIALMASSEGSDFGGSDVVSGTSGSASWMRTFPSADVMGRVECHCDNFLATPRQTGSLLRSSGVHTRPRMNL